MKTMERRKIMKVSLKRKDLNKKLKRKDQVHGERCRDIATIFSRPYIPSNNYSKLPALAKANITPYTLCIPKDPFIFKYKMLHLGFPGKWK